MNTTTTERQADEALAQWNAIMEQAKRDHLAELARIEWERS